MQTLQAVLERSARAYPQRVALELGSYQLTYCQLQTQVREVAHHLNRSGITAHDTVAFLFQNTPTCIIGFLALASLEARVVLLGPDVSSHELASISADAHHFAAIIGCSPKFSQLQQVFSNHSPLSIDLTNLLATPCSPPSTGDLPLASARKAAEDVFLYHYTSGSTGKPKAALHSQANLINGAAIYQETFHIGSEDSILVPIPLYHSFGMVAGLITSLLSGARLVLLDRFIPHHLVQTLAAERISILLAVPLIYDLLARCSLPSTPDLRLLRVCLSSGAPLALATTRTFFARYRHVIYQAYGSTETGAIAAQWPCDSDWPEQSIGRPLRGISVRIVNEEGQDVPCQREGTLLVKTPTMFVGYFNHESLTTRVLRDGWYITGDIARQDEEGFLYLIGRKDTFINVGGKKVNPHEVEEVLLSHPRVQETVVCGAIAGNAGEYVKAIVVMKEKVDEQELIAFCRKQLAPHMVPHHIEFVPELPRTSMGKLRRANHVS